MWVKQLQENDQASHHRSFICVTDVKCEVKHFKNDISRIYCSIKDWRTIQINSNPQHISLQIQYLGTLP